MYEKIASVKDGMVSYKYLEVLYFLLASNA